MPTLILFILLILLILLLFVKIVLETDVEEPLVL